MVDAELAARDPQRRFDALARLIADELPEAKPRIVPLLADSFAPVRAQAACALGDLGDRGADVVDALAPLLEDEPLVAYEAALALSRLGDGRGVNLLLTALWDGRALDAVSALGEVDLHDNQVAATALRRLARRWFGEPLAKLRAAVVLARAGFPDGRALVERLTTSWRREIRALAQKELALLDGRP